MRAPNRNAIKKQLIGMGRHLVYSEGTKTEPYYVENISDYLPVDPSHRDVLIPKKYSKTKHTIELIKRAESDVKNQRNKGFSVDSVWILFDKDSFDDFDLACKLIEEKNTVLNDNGYLADKLGTVWHCCYSNESFEIWPYLHFEDLTTPLSRDDYIEKIDTFIKSRGFNGHYLKNNKKPYDFLIANGGNMAKAIKYAKRKDAGLGKIKTNPSTGLYEFAEFFSAYMNK